MSRGSDGDSRQKMSFHKRKHGDDDEEDKESNSSQSSEELAAQVKLE